MGSSERDEIRQHHPPHISSLIVRPSGSNDGDYEPGEVSRERRSNGHTSCSTPPRHSRGRDLSSRRETSGGRHRDYSPPYARGGAGTRPHHETFKSEGISRINTPKVLPRDGDWYCQDPLCRNLNFMRRECCYKCKKPRYGPVNTCSPNLSPRRHFNSYRSPPRACPRDYPPPRHDHPTWRDRDRERLPYPPSRRIASHWLHAEPHYDRRPPRGGGGWGCFSRERIRSPPLRDGPPPPDRDYRRYFERGGRDDRDGRGNRMENSY